MSTPTTTSSPTAPRPLRRIAATVLGATLLVGAWSGVAGAKEVGSGGGTVTTTACAPVSALTYKGDARTAETGLASIKVNYSVKSCTSAPVTVEVALYLSAAPNTVAYLDTAAPLSGKITVLGVTSNTSYTAKVTVRDAATGAVVGTKSIFAAAVYKGV